MLTERDLHEKLEQAHKMVNFPNSKPSASTGITMLLSFTRRRGEDSKGDTL